MLSGALHWGATEGKMMSVRTLVALLVMGGLGWLLGSDPVYRPNCLSGCTDGVNSESRPSDEPDPSAIQQ
jgi:hypothetical protein